MSKENKDPVENNNNFNASFSYLLFFLSVEMLIQSIKPKTSMKLLLKKYRANYSTKLSFKDWNIVHKWVLETLRWKITIDYLIEEFLGLSITKNLLKITTLELASYLILFEKFPITNVITWTKEFLRNNNIFFKKAYVSYFFQLKNLDLNRYKPQGGKITQLSFKYSLPKWFVKKLLSQLGLEMAKKIFISYSKTPENRYVFLNPLIQPIEKTVQELFKQDILLEQDSILENTFLIKKNSSKLVFTDAYNNGAIVFQDWGSIAIGQALPIGIGWTVLDACAAPGNKTLQLVTKRKASIIIAGEFNFSRTKLLKDRISNFKLGMPVITYDARMPSFNYKFDSVLADVPCTGTGTFSSHPELKWRITPELVNANSKLQLEILKGITRFIKNNGYVLYSTCSVLKEENEDNVISFLEENPSWKLVEDFEVDIGVPSSFLRETRRIFPNNKSNEAFFIALLQKKK